MSLAEAPGPVPTLVTELTSKQSCSSIIDAEGPNLDLVVQTEKAVEHVGLILRREYEVA